MQENQKDYTKAVRMIKEVILSSQYEENPKDFKSLLRKILFQRILLSMGKNLPWKKEIFIMEKIDIEPKYITRVIIGIRRSVFQKPLRNSPFVGSPFSCILSGCPNFDFFMACL